MKQKWLAVILIGVMILSILGGCSKDSESTNNATSSDNTIYGEVSAVGDSSITIKVGTMNAMERPSGANSENATLGERPSDIENNSENQMKQNGRGFSMLELTGEEKEIKITDDTVIKKQQIGGFGRGNMGAGSEQQSGEENQGEMPSGGEGQTMPEMPNGADGQTPPEMPNGEGGQGQMPEMPSDAEGQERPEMPSGENGRGGFGQSAEEINLEDIAEGDTVIITLDDNGDATEIMVMSFGGMGQPGNNQEGMGNQMAGVDSYEAVNEYDSDAIIEDENFKSTGTDENAIHVLSNASAIFNDIKITRNSSNSTGGDNSSFYGVGAALLTTSGTSYIKSSDISTNAAGGAGIFAYGDGIVYTADTTIKTKKDTSGGIHAAGGGTLYAWDMNVETNGESSAAIRSDRGGGKMVVDGGTYISNGTGSPVIYSTADIAVNDADLKSTGSEAICIEGLNSIHLFDSNLTGNMSDDKQNDCTWNVILYQSMSGDSEVGNSTFEMNGGSLTAKNGGMFYTTNTESTFILKNVDITYAKDSEFFLQCTGNNNQRGWGTVGSNGADCLFTAINQDMKGDIIWDSISNLDFYMTDKSTFNGAIKNDETYAGNGGEGYCNIYIEKGSVWTVTGNSTISKLSNAGTIKDADGKTVAVKGTDGTVYVKGDSKYTITVDSYETNADLSGASSATDWSDYKVEKPEELA